MYIKVMRHSWTIKKPYFLGYIWGCHIFWGRLDLRDIQDRYYVAQSKRGCYRNHKPIIFSYTPATLDLMQLASIVDIIIFYRLQWKAFMLHKGHSWPCGFDFEEEQDSQSFTMYSQASFVVCLCSNFSSSPYIRFVMKLLCQNLPRSVKTNNLLCWGYPCYKSSAIYGWGDSE